MITCKASVCNPLEERYAISARDRKSEKLQRLKSQKNEDGAKRLMKSFAMLTDEDGNFVA